MRDYLREMVGAHISLHTNYIIRDLGSPPSIERAKAITDTIPMDIRIEDLAEPILSDHQRVVLGEVDPTTVPQVQRPGRVRADEIALNRV